MGDRHGPPGHVLIPSSLFGVPAFRFPRRLPQQRGGRRTRFRASPEQTRTPEMDRFRARVPTCMKHFTHRRAWTLALALGALGALGGCGSIGLRDDIRREWGGIG